MLEDSYNHIERLDDGRVLLKELDGSGSHLDSFVATIEVDEAGALILHSQVSLSSSEPLIVIRGIERGEFEVTENGSQFVVSASLNYNRQIRKQWTFDASSVQHVTFIGSNGADFFRNRTSLKVRAYGHAGNDVLVGGGGVDVLIGGANDDLLYGGPGADELYGGPGLDSLFAGLGLDPETMLGGPGSDRFLTGIPATSVLSPEMTDYSPENDGDARINFLSGVDDSGKADNKDDDVTAGNWTIEEVQIVDQAFSSLVARTNNTALLDLGDRRLNFVRHGEKSSSDNADASMPDVATFRIRMFDNAFTDANGRLYDVDQDGRIGFGELPRTLQTVIHEIGHFWDNIDTERWKNFLEGEDPSNPRWLAKEADGYTEGWNNFSNNPWLLDANGLPELDANGAFIPIRDTRDSRGWWFRNDLETSFARMYGHTNPLEDFATSFAAVFLGSEYAGENYDTNDSDGQSGQADGAGQDSSSISFQAKFINDWLDSLA